MTKEEKSLLDTIAFTEGTLGVSQNGYDVIVGFYKIVGWNPDTTTLHGGDNWFSKQLKSTAGGRYQFIESTWKEMNGGKNTPFTKTNQDAAAIKLINRKLGDLDKTQIHKSKTKFEEAMNKLASTWASIPLSSTGKSYYDGDGINSAKNIDNIFEIYKLALSKY